MVITCGGLRNATNSFSLRVWQESPGNSTDIMLLRSPESRWVLHSSSFDLFSVKVTVLSTHNRQSTSCKSCSH
ncbi:hypothetical protein PISMIDRAFT_678043 [Pisolithus microcarpus 441]|uniref:Unplaced genomic scaffold scaffold_220, whole genome shotgun sequence n=1 Tax=Pisolithus microcarpus 441 TaxID=765257 RepID=A0A0C9ZQT1_9AGAM|nr:hypothetical protein PISMIDRAFT_687478 [Pisolithus microcarpus 441]KIK24657.1 hypothetical protein PISMIDRAFT_678043 [Pisolithus microcarpus 441]